MRAPSEGRRKAKGLAARAGVLAALLALPGCATTPAPPADTLPPEQRAFLAGLQQLCGRTFSGTAIEAPPTDTLFTGRALRVRFAECSEERVVLPVEVGDDRSRTWIVAREGDALRLTHIHRRADGGEDDGSRYGGVTRTPGTPLRQDFPADTPSIRQVPGRATQTWTLELRPGEHLDYSLHRVETGLRYRFRFPLGERR